MKAVSITAIHSVSSLGSGTTEAWKAYQDQAHALTHNGDYWAGRLPGSLQPALQVLRASSSHYRELDPSVIMALYSARAAVSTAGWKAGDDFGINVGSSRGATERFEAHHQAFLSEGRVPTLASPTTTLGNISSWLAHDLKSKGPEISHSITCSTALHALLNGVAWLSSGMSKKFLVGGAEAPLTPFTIAQMRALKIYSRASVTEQYPCKALDTDKSGNTMVLGEGAAMACLESGIQPNARALIRGLGYATEPLEHSVSLSSDAACFQASMKQALGELSPSAVDGIVLHAPGTRKGDASELAAIEAVFGKTAPALTTNKWKIGHTFGASGLLSLELAVLMLEQQQWVGVPFVKEPGTSPSGLKRILVNAVGFGGNAVSVLLERP